MTETLATPNASTTSKAPMSKAYCFYQAFKYSIYCLLSYNILLFFQADLAASAQTFRNGVELADVVEAFSATVDTVAWVVLLILFELETFVISDERIVGATKWTLNSVKAICYLFICFACYGFIVKLLLVLNTSFYQIADACSLIGTGFTYAVKLDDYLPITESVCQSLNNVPLFQINGTEIIATESALIETQRLAWVESVNSVDWILVVAVLEVDVYLQLKGKLTGRVRRLSQIVKPVLYGVLFFNAVYWGIKGDFLDFWDAFLWLVAFIFIEMNIFEWHSDTENEAEEEAAVAVSS